MRPILRPPDYSRLDRILPKIQPLLTVTFSAPQTTVEKIALPDWRFFPIGPPPSHLTAPKPRPGYDRRRWRDRWRAEKVEMIRQNNPSAHQPMIRLAPAVQQQGHDFRSCQQRTALCHAHCQEYYGRLIGEFQGRKMWQAPPTRLEWIHRHEICYRQKLQQASQNQSESGERRRSPLPQFGGFGRGERREPLT